MDTSPESEPPEFLHPRPGSGFSRRDALRGGVLSAAAAGFGAQAVSAQEGTAQKPADDRRSSVKKYSKMKKSINLWAFPYPDRMNLRECLQLAKDAGFDGIELNYDLESDLSPKATTADYHKIRKMADDIGIEISGLCSFLFWPYPMSSHDDAKRNRGIELAGMIAKAAHDLGVEMSSSCPVRFTFRGGMITNRSPMTFVISGRKTRSESCFLKRKSSGFF